MLISFILSYFHEGEITRTLFVMVLIVGSYFLNFSFPFLFHGSKIEV